VIDIATGTGIVPRTFPEVAQASGLLVGCDRSAGMLLRAGAQVVGLNVLVGALEAALARAGFSPLRSDAVAVESNLTVDQFLDDRALSSGGRLGFHLLGPDGWERFRAAAGEMFRAPFGSSFRYRRDALVLIARKARSTLGNGPRADFRWQDSARFLAGGHISEKRQGRRSVCEVGQLDVANIEVPADMSQRLQSGKHKRAGTGLIGHLPAR